MVTKEESDSILAGWNESAAYWEKHRETIRALFDPITRAMAKMAGIGPGQIVLDVAGGTGEPSLTLSEIVGPTGWIASSDAVYNMTALATGEAARRGLTNIAFCECLADRLPFPNSFFDVAVSRLGAMFFPDVEAAFRELLRVVTPGGHLVFAVWRAREFNPFFGIVTDALSRFIESPPEDPMAPGAFRFAEPGALASILKAAGAVSVKEQVAPFRMEIDLSPEQFWQTRFEMSDTLREKVKGLTADQHRDLLEQVIAAGAAYSSAQGMNLPAEVLLVTGQRLAVSGA